VFLAVVEAEVQPQHPGVSRRDRPRT
jgi:hypothetical protein